MPKENPKEVTEEGKKQEGKKEKEKLNGKEVNRYLLLRRLLLYSGARGRETLVKKLFPVFHCYVLVFI